MPTLLIWRGHKFRFYALYDGEPPHVHVVKDGKTLKVWLKSMEIATNRGYNDREVASIVEIVDLNRDQWMERWNEFFGL